MLTAERAKRLEAEKRARDVEELREQAAADKALIRKLQAELSTLKQR